MSKETRFPNRSICGNHDSVSRRRDVSLVTPPNLYTKDPIYVVSVDPS